MLIYLDMCCLKRPFDDQAQPRNRLESEIILAVIAKESTDFQIIRSAALVLENDQNPIKERAARVAAWLAAAEIRSPLAATMQARVSELMGLGFKNFDALHIASAEAAGAEVLVTCDDRLLRVAARNEDALKLRLVSVVQAAKELLS